MAHLAVSVIVTVYNERQQIDRLLDSLLTQSRLPDEIVFCDGGSTDGTVEHLRARLTAQASSGLHATVNIESPSMSQAARATVAAADTVPFKILVEVGANISRGRNLAIGAAQGPIIAVTDAGVRLAPNWLEELIRPWTELETTEQENSPESPAPPPRRDWRSTDVIAVAGFFAPDVEGVFQTAMAATVLPLEDDIDPARFLPSSRSVAFLKQTWREAGEYPEWLDYCEDLIFDLRVNASGQGAGAEGNRFVWRPQARVYFRPRENLRAFWRQYYLYARGDGKADLWRKRHTLRYSVYLVLAPALIGHALWGRFARGLGWLGLLIGFAAYMWRPWQRVIALGHALSLAEVARALLWAPVIRITGDVAKMAGYPVGRWWRWQNRDRPEIDWRNAARRKSQSRPDTKDAA